MNSNFSAKSKDTEKDTAHEDNVIKQVLLSGFNADNSTCNEANLRFLLQQKTKLKDQWKYSRRELLLILKQNFDKVNRADMESLVQLPEEDDSDLGLNGVIEEEDEEDLQETSTEEENIPVIEPQMDSNTSEEPIEAQIETLDDQVLSEELQAIRQLPLDAQIVQLSKRLQYLEVNVHKEIQDIKAELAYLFSKLNS